MLRFQFKDTNAITVRVKMDDNERREGLNGVGSVGSSMVVKWIYMEDKFYP